MVGNGGEAKRGLTSIDVQQAIVTNYLANL